MVDGPISFAKRIVARSSRRCLKTVWVVWGVENNVLSFPCLVVSVINAFFLFLPFISPMSFSIFSSVRSTVVSLVAAGSGWVASAVQVLAPERAGFVVGRLAGLGTACLPAGMTAGTADPSPRAGDLGFGRGVRLGAGENWAYPGTCDTEGV